MKILNKEGERDFSVRGLTRNDNKKKASCFDKTQDKLARNNNITTAILTSTTKTKPVFIVQIF